VYLFFLHTFHNMANRDSTVPTNTLEKKFRNSSFFFSVRHRRESSTKCYTCYCLFPIRPLTRRLCLNIYKTSHSALMVQIPIPRKHAKQ